MTLPLPADEVAAKVNAQFPGSVSGSGAESLIVNAESLLAVAAYLKNTPEFDFSYLSSITGVDYGDYFEVVYNLISIEGNHSLFLKARCYDRDNPALPSVVGLWQGADLQEREIFDLLGIRFEGHPNLRRIVMYEGFQGHPLRKDYWQWVS